MAGQKEYSPRVIAWERPAPIHARCEVCGEAATSEYIVTEQCEPRDHDLWHVRCHTHRLTSTSPK